MVSLKKWTLPSHMTNIAPPGWRLLNPQALHHSLLPLPELSYMVFSGMVVPQRGQL